MKNLLALTAVSAALLVAAPAEAQQIRLFVENAQNRHLYEVRPGSGTGGRFVHQPFWFNGSYVAGFTDRASRGERIGTAVLGTGFANVWITVNGQTRAFVPHIPLPLHDVRRVSTNPFDDNVVVWVQQGGRTINLRVPIGRR